MKALVKREAAPGLWLDDVDAPVMGDDEVLIKVRKTSICGTDVHIYKWDEWSQRTVPVPMVIGHEFVGEIAELGKNVTGFNVGDIVTGEGHLTCGECRNCRTGKRHFCAQTKGIGYDCPGCFAEYFTLPAENVFPIPPTIDEDIAAIFDPFGNAVHTALSFDFVAEDVLITGAGPIGIMATAIARHAGARNVVVTDVNPYRLELAKSMGATRVVDVSKEKVDSVLESLLIREGFDVGLEMSGTGAGLNTILDNCLWGAKIALLGLLPKNTEIDWPKVIFQGVTLKGIYGREIFETWYKMVHLIEAGLDLSPVITHRFPAEEFQKGFDAMLSGKAGKVILDWTR